MKQKKDFKDINVLCSREKLHSGLPENQLKESQQKNENINCDNRIKTTNMEIVKSAHNEDQTAMSSENSENTLSISTEEHKTEYDARGIHSSSADEVSFTEKSELNTIKLENSESARNGLIVDINHSENSIATESDTEKTVGEQENMFARHDNNNPEIETIKKANEVTNVSQGDSRKQNRSDLIPVIEEDEETNRLGDAGANASTFSVVKSKKESVHIDLTRKDSNVSLNGSTKTCNKTLIMNTKTKRPVSKQSRRPASSAEMTKSYENMFERRPYSAIDATKYRSYGATSASPRRKSRDPFLFTKAELNWYLPRKSNFDCHDKALKDAGLMSEETINKMEMRKKRIEEKLRREKEARLRAKQAKEGTSDQTKDESGTEIENQSPVVDLKVHNIEDENEEEFHEEPDLITAVEITQTNQTGVYLSTSQPTKKPTKGKRKGRRDDDEDDVRVDYQPLLVYLRFVQENPDDFLSYQKSPSQIQFPGHKADPRTLRMAQIMERKNRSCVINNESILVQAVKAIRPRVTDPGQWQVANKERNLINNLGAINTRKETQLQNTKQESSDSHQSSEEPKTEYEKEKFKLDKWLKTLSTAQLNKAKELALKDLGEEDFYQTRWWSALQTCSYIRQKRHVEMTAT